MSEYFGRYRLVERLGGGSLGEVFLAEARDGSVVALKRLAREHLESPEHIATLARESAIAARMQHQRLLGTLECGDVDGWPFHTQPLAEGGSLLALLAPALPRAQLGIVARDLCEALAAVHANGFVHSDLSPSNLLMDKGRVRLADFSAAIELGRKQAKPAGTYAFMSPEQVKGDPLDERSDVFSAATLIWLCATGERIFARNAPHLCFMAVVDDEPAPMPTELAALERVLRPALAKEPGARTADLESFARALEAVLRDFPPQP